MDESTTSHASSRPIVRSPDTGRSEPSSKVSVGGVISTTPVSSPPRRGMKTSVEEGRVDAAQQVVTAQITAQVLGEELDQPRVLVHGERGGVRAEDHVVELPERARFGQGLLGEHVERGPSELARSKRVDQRLLVDHTAATDVDEDRPVAQARNRLVADQSARLVGERQR